MMAWLCAHGGDLLVLMVLAGIVGRGIRSMLRDRKKGSCCGGCKGCSRSCQNSKP